MPHLERAVRIHAELNRATSERDLYANTVDQLSLGTIILDDNGEVLSSNQLASDILAERDGIFIQANRLRIDDAEGNRELQKLIQAGTSVGERDKAVMVSALRVRRPSGATDLGLALRPIKPGEWSDRHSAPCLAIYISDPGRQAEASHHVLAELFDLTPAEARLSILLAQGLGLTQAAEELGVAHNTTRTQLRSIFAKTGVTRQAELVGLILKSVATLG